LGGENLFGIALYHAVQAMLKLVRRDGVEPRLAFLSNYFEEGRVTQYGLRSVIACDVELPENAKDASKLSSLLAKLSAYEGASNMTPAFSYAPAPPPVPAPVVTPAIDACVPLRSSAQQCDAPDFRAFRLMRPKSSVPFPRCVLFVSFCYCELR